MGDLVMVTFPCHLDQALGFNQTPTWMLLQMYFADVVKADRHLTIRKADQSWQCGWAWIPPAEGLQSKNRFFREEIQCQDQSLNPYLISRLLVWPVGFRLVSSYGNCMSRFLKTDLILISVYLCMNVCIYLCIYCCIYSMHASIYVSMNVYMSVSIYLLMYLSPMYLSLLLLLFLWRSWLIQGSCLDFKNRRLEESEAVEVAA